MAAPYTVAKNELEEDDLEALTQEGLDQSLADETVPPTVPPPRPSTVPDAWLSRARTANPDATDPDLIAYYEQKHAPAPKHLPMLTDWLPRAQQSNPDTDPEELQEYWAEKYGRHGAKEQPDPERDFMRGAETAVKQLPQLASGLEAGIGAAGEYAFGEGGLSTAIKEHGVKGYVEQSEKIAKESRPSDSATTAYEMATKGDPGALVDFIQYGLGYMAVQGVEMLATGGMGYAVGKLGAQGAAKLVAEKMIAKEAARLSAQSGAIQVSEAMTKQAVANVAGKIGQTTALAGTAVGMEGGEIFGDLTAEAQKEGRTLDGEQLAKAFGATVAAGALEFVGDKIGFDLMVGKSPVGRLAREATGVGGRAARGAIQGAAGAVAEGGTEFGQTLIEEAGKGKDPFSEASIKAAVDGAVLGGLGGSMYGAGSGALRGAQSPQPDEPDEWIEQAVNDVAEGQPIRLEATLPQQPVVPAPTIDDILSAPDVDTAIAHAEAMVSAAPGSASGERVLEPGLREQAEADQFARQIERGGSLPDQTDIQAPVRTRTQPFETPILSRHVPEGTDVAPLQQPSQAWMGEALSPVPPTIQPGQAFTPRAEPEPDPRAAIQAERNRLIAQRESAIKNRGTVEVLPEVLAQEPTRETPPVEAVPIPAQHLSKRLLNGSGIDSLKSSVSDPTPPQQFDTQLLGLDKQEEATSKPLPSAADKAYPSVDDIHQLAESKGIVWDNDAKFMAFTEQTTGKKHLDKLEPAERLKMAEALQAVERPANGVQKEKDRLLAKKSSVQPMPSQGRQKPELANSPVSAPISDQATNEAPSSETAPTPQKTAVQVEKEKLRRKPRAEQPSEGYRILPVKTRTSFEGAYTGAETQDRPSIRTLKEWLNPSNKTLRGEFERRAGVKLPKALAATNAAVEAYFGKAKEAVPTKDIQAENLAKDVPTTEVQSEPFSLTAKAVAKPKAPKPEQLGIDVPAPTIGEAPIIGREVDTATAATEAPLFSKDAQTAQAEQTALPVPAPEPKPVTVDYASIPTGTTVRIKGIRASTGDEITVQEDAAVALQDLDVSLKKYQQLMECLGR